MIHDRLLINDNKTELILIGSKHQYYYLSKLQLVSISGGNSTVINNSSVVKNLGCWLDTNLSMSKHTNVCNSAFFYLHNIRTIEKYFQEDNPCTLVHGKQIRLQCFVWCLKGTSS